MKLEEGINEIFDIYSCNNSEKFPYFLIVGAGVFNLYGKQFINSVSNVMPKLIAKQTAKGLAVNGAINIITSLLSAVFRR